MSNPTNTCRNCGGTEFYTGNCPRTVAIEIKLFALPPKFRLRVCGTCGLMDWFLPQKDLRRIKKTFSREGVR